MHSTSSSRSSHSSLPASLGLAALGLLSLGLAAAPARAQTQDLFVSNDGTNTISRFAGTGPGTFSTTATTLSDPNMTLNGPRGLVFDSRGDLFAANFNSTRSGVNNGNGNTITEFAAGTTPGTLGAGTVALTGGLTGPEGLAFDSHGDLFAANANSGSITEFAFTPGTGTTPGTFGAGTAALTGLSAPGGLAFDAKGDLFAANLNSSTITEFAFTPGTGTTPGTFGAGMTFATSASGLSGPRGLVFDSRGDLFAANIQNSTITKFAFNAVSGTFGAGTNFTDPSLGAPFGLAFDARGDLFAVNVSGSITEFAFTAGTGTTPDTLGAGMVVETGLSSPRFLTFGPSAPPAVPEASTTVSLGLLLALGLGGLVVAARKRRKG